MEGTQAMSHSVSMCEPPVKYDQVGCAVTEFQIVFKMNSQLFLTLQIILIKDDKVAKVTGRPLAKA